MELTATKKIEFLKLLLLFSLFQIEKTEGYSHILTCNFPDHKTTPGSTLECSCQVDSTRSGNKDALWYRVYGQTKQIIGINHQIDYQFQSKRYTLIYKDSKIIHAVYILRVENLKLYDGMTIQCISPISRALTPQNTYSLAVCDNVNSSFCDCMSRKGWASPKCHENKLEADLHAESLRRACIVIGILMAIVLILSILITIKMLHRDIKNYIENKRDKRLQQQTINETQSENSQVPPQSILKKPQKNINVHNNDPNLFIDENQKESFSAVKNNSFSSNETDSTITKSDSRLEQQEKMKHRYQVEYKHPSTIQPNNQYLPKEVGFIESENEYYNEVNVVYTPEKNNTSALNTPQKTKRTNKKKDKKGRKPKRPDETQLNTQEPFRGTEI